MTHQECKRSRVAWLFPMTEARRLMCHLADTNWDFRRFGPVTLRKGELQIPLLYKAFGDIKGQPVLELHLGGDGVGSVGEIVAQLSQEQGDMWVESSIADT